MSAILGGVLDQAILRHLLNKTFHGLLRMFHPDKVPQDDEGELLVANTVSRVLKDGRGELVRDWQGCTVPWTGSGARR